MATVREVMKKTLYSVDPSTTVGEAISLMAQNRIGSALIMEGGKLIGIFTERDTVRAISQSHDAPTHEISSWMTRDPRTVSPDIEVDDALRTMLDNGFRHLPVVERGEVIGMVSMRDLAELTTD
ncbi:MAG TPA: CBS domain-containing protein [Candidatus Nitrosotalea sp.]|nr:CBS domain-containing protein [Candidatus Nitrosotalea sp.]